MFAIPSLEELVVRYRNAFRANLPGTDAWLWPNNVNSTAKVCGGGSSELFGFLDRLQLAKFALTAEGPDLDEHGAELTLGRGEPKPSAGTVVLTVADSVAVAFGAILQRSDGVQFSAMAPASRNGAGALNVPVQSVKPGATTVTLAGTALSIVSGLTDINGDAAATAAVDSNGLIGGDDVEQDGAKFNPPPGTYRYRILFKRRNPPMGGAASDYVIWAQEANPRVTRVFVERLWAGQGTVRVSILMDGTYGNGIPQPADIAQIAAYIAALQPSGAIVTVQAPTPVPVNVSIGGLLPNNPATQSAVRLELAAAFIRLSAVAGVDVPNPAMPYLAVPFTFRQQWLVQAVQNATGVTGGFVGAPSVDTVPAPGRIATLGTLTFA